MERNVMLFLGNGFSIDLMKQIDCTKDVNLTNLFAQGMNVPWPATGKPGFLSYKHCPNLWTLGARPYLDNEGVTQIIEEVITCANILPQRKHITNKIYINAYNELEQYLMSLFVYYTGSVNLDKKLSSLKKWGWYRYFKKIQNDPNIKNVYIVTLNYDIWLETLLDLWKIPYDMDGFTTEPAKFRIYKPHGSIAFETTLKRDKLAYEIQYRDTFDNHKINEFQYNKNGLDCLNLVNAIIPPAGDSNRMKQQWSMEIRDHIKNKAANLGKEDQVVLCGISYWHVDRAELDTYLSSINPGISTVVTVNPFPTEVFNSVLTTLFDNYMVIPNSSNLIKL